MDHMFADAVDLISDVTFDDKNLKCVSCCDEVEVSTAVYMVARKWQPSPNSHHISFYDTTLFPHDDTTLKPHHTSFELEGKKTWCGDTTLIFMQFKRSVVWIGRRLSLTGHHTFIQPRRLHVCDINGRGHTGRSQCHCNTAKSLIVT